MFPKVEIIQLFEPLGSNMYLVVYVVKTMHELRLFLNNFRKTGKTAHVFPAKTRRCLEPKVCKDRDIDVWETVQDMA
jgi:hypothetical protein